MALAAETSRPTLSAYEHGRKIPTLDTATRIVRAAGFTLQPAPVVTFHDVVGVRDRIVVVPDRLWRLPIDRALALVTLPLHLAWSGPSQIDLADRRQRARAYEVVLREGGPDDLLDLVDGALPPGDSHPQRHRGAAEAGASLGLGPGRRAAGPTELCSCLTTAFGLDADGVPWQATNRSGYYPGYRRSPAKEGVPVPASGRGGSVVASPRLVVSTGGEVTAGIGLRYSSAQQGRPRTLPLLVLGAAGQRTVQVQRPGTGPAAAAPAQPGDEIGSPLEWTSAGIVLSYEKGPSDATRQTSLVLVDPGTGLSRTLGVGDGRSIPLAVSDALPTGSAPERFPTLGSTR